MIITTLTLTVDSNVTMSVLFRYTLAGRPVLLGCKLAVSATLVALGVANKNMLDSVSGCVQPARTWVTRRAMIGAKRHPDVSLFSS